MERSHIVAVMLDYSSKKLSQLKNSDNYNEFSFTVLPGAICIVLQLISRVTPSKESLKVIATFKCNADNFRTQIEFQIF